MIDYAKALKQGFDAARQATAARNEIVQVFKDLNDQVNRATGDKVAIRLRDPERRQELDGSGHWTGGEQYKVIAAFNPTVDPKTDVKLATLAMDKAGYPCNVKWGNQEHICEDGEALALCLSDLLSDPLVGQKIQTLMEPKKKDG
ncbi:MAG: hypothetical protein ABSE73_05665 [Planctomycetota bacterium]